METVVSVKDLCRTYSPGGKKNKVNALQGITFEVKKGEVFGLLGPNGAGKTTTIKILTTLLAPTSGESKVLSWNTFGEEKKIRPHINFVFGGELGVYRRLTGRENLIYFANLYKLEKQTKSERINELLDLVGLSSAAEKKVDTYSKGMVQRLQIARGLINDPDILFLDEPTIGLDPIGARELREIVKTLAARGKTVLLTTHYMYEADELCDRIAIINHGKLITLDTPENLKAQSGLCKVIEIAVKEFDEKKMNALKASGGVEAVTVKSEGEKQILQIHCEHQWNNIPRLLELLDYGNILAFSERDTTLEDVYVKLIGGQS